MKMLYVIRKQDYFCAPMKKKTALIIAVLCIMAVLLLPLIFIWSKGIILEHKTFVWFNDELPNPCEVSKWNQNERFNRLYKLSRWEGFLSGTQFNRFVRSQINGCLPKHHNHSRHFHFLEIGVGVGAFAMEILKMYPYSNGVGIDVVEQAIAIAKVVLPPSRMHVEMGDMRHIKYGGSEFDVVFVPGAICYLASIDDVKIAMGEISRVLKPNGSVCLSMIASDTSEMGSCNVRIPKNFWKGGGGDFKLIRDDNMDDWHLPHALGRYSVCLMKINKTSL